MGADPVGNGPVRVGGAREAGAQPGQVRVEGVVGALEGLDGGRRRRPFGREPGIAVVLERR